MPKQAEAVEKAIRDGQISKNQIQFIIAYLACFSKGLLIPGGSNNNSTCNRARLASGIGTLITNDLGIFPSGMGEIPSACKECPVFAPALISLSRLLPH
ncbi:MAG: hypothetical protein UR54_C0001G0019 [Candidatus Roizmanbacteria bacterium GW2011_GWA2_34_18]|uniref:Uncharacterized protein n=1 Tax=Candidatus Roizmanbacteria bacterium GW2011_GWA2_34_18 TaxID=1618477 RepID=A0A0G0AWR6_9BACT|nr:MAG: hypothetical protein UR54_C0001G0019 [Candidatus Roizmanbacteria bacterium GW2011_GWA2_34_18]